MYAVIEVGGKQYNVKVGDVLEVEKQEADKGAQIALDKVLFTAEDKDIRVGRPYLEGACVIADVISQTKAKKLISYKYRRRKDSHWKKGHRQQLTRIKIKEIKAD